MNQALKPMYDDEFDVLYLTFSDKSNSYGDDISDCVTVMRDWDTDIITGLTIFDFMRLYKADELRNTDMPVEVNFAKDVVPFIQ